MNKNDYLIIPVCHGVEFKDFDVNSMNPFIGKILNGVNDPRLIMFPFIWHDEVNKRQQELVEVKFKGMNKRGIREMLGYGWTDELGYNRVGVSGSTDTIFHRIHQKLDREIKVRQGLIKNGTSRIAAIGHSWGGQIIFDHAYLYNQMDLLFTMGTPIQYQAIAFDDWGAPPKVMRWVNFWNTEDPISTIISRTNDKFAFVTDIETHQSLAIWEKTQIYGSLRAHLSYWKSDKVTNKIIETIKDYLDYCHITDPVPVVPPKVS